MDGDVLNQRVRKFRAPHAGMAQRAIALAVPRLKPPVIGWRARFVFGRSNRAGAGWLCQSTATSRSPDRGPSTLAEPSRLPVG